MDGRKTAASMTRPAIIIRFACAACFVAVGFSVFLPYWAKNDNLKPGSQWSYGDQSIWETEEYTGAELISTSTPIGRDRIAVELPVAALVVGLVGLLLTAAPGRGGALALFIVSTVGLLALFAIDVHLYGAIWSTVLWGYHIGAEFLAGVAVVLSLVLWRLATRAAALAEA